MPRTPSSLVIALLLSACHGSPSPIPVGGDVASPDAVSLGDAAWDATGPRDTLPPGDTPSPLDAVPPLDTPQDLPMDAAPDALLPDTPPDAPPDATAPPGCCIDASDCTDPMTGALMACAGKGLGEPAWAGVCVLPVSEPGRCWEDGDCPASQVCHGVALCGCGVDCEIYWQGPGVCITPAAACQALKPSWVDEICDAAGVVVWDGQGCVATCPGCCGCLGWCDLTFETLEDCEALCTTGPGDPCPTYVAALAQSHYAWVQDLAPPAACPELKTLDEPCADDGDCPLMGSADAGGACVLGNCSWCWDDGPCPPETVCRSGRCVKDTTQACPDPGTCSAPGCHLVTPSEVPCPVCVCDTPYGLPCTSDEGCMLYSFHPFSRCVWGRCADCRNNADCASGHCIQPGICYGMTPPESVLFGTWLIGWAGGLNHFSYIRFEPDGTLRRGSYDSTSDPSGGWMDDVPPFWNTCDPGWPVPSPLLGTWEPEMTQSGFLVVRVSLNLPCAADQGWTTRWMVGMGIEGDWATFEDIDGDLDYEGWKVAPDLCLPDLSLCPSPTSP